MNENMPNIERDSRAVLEEIINTIDQVARILHQKGLEALNNVPSTEAEELLQSLKDFDKMIKPRDISKPST